MTTTGELNRILVVEDEEQIRSLLECVLEGEGYQVAIADSADAAIKILEDSSFELILSDVMMPGTSGIEFLELVKERNPLQEFIIMTGYPKVTAAVHAIKIGAFDYISKPFEIAEILERVSSALAHRSHREACLELDTTIEVESTRILAGYRIERTLGEGMMGIVFLATKVIEGKRREFAIKIIKNQPLQKGNESLERFFKEAETASRLNSENIIRVIEHGYAREENIPYMVMEYFEAMPLKKKMEQNLSGQEKLSILIQIAKALETAHSIGVVHRDIKPDNILIDDQLLIKLSDFGIVQLPGSDQTNIMKIIGTPYYLAPEGYTSPKVDGRADLYSLGTLAYELFLGKRPFEGESISSLGFRIQTENPPAPNKVDSAFSPQLQRIIERLMKKNPEDRFQSATELVRELQDLEEVGLQKKSFLAKKPSWNTL